MCPPASGQPEVGTTARTKTHSAWTPTHSIMITTDCGLARHGRCVDRRHQRPPDRFNCRRRRTALRHYPKADAPRRTAFGMPPDHDTNDLYTKQRDTDTRRSPAMSAFSVAVPPGGKSASTAIRRINKWWNGVTGTGERSRPSPPIDAPECRGSEHLVKRTQRRSIAWTRPRSASCLSTLSD